MRRRTCPGYRGLPSALKDTLRCIYENSDLCIYPSLRTNIGPLSLIQQQSTEISAPSIRRGDQSKFSTSLRERQKAERYKRILDSAELLFRFQEFSPTTIAEIADRAEVSTPTVFNYFKTKDQLQSVLTGNLRVNALKVGVSG